MNYDKDWIDDKVCDLMMMYGPDGHVDGHEKITEFITLLLKGKSTEDIEQELLNSTKKDIQSVGTSKWMIHALNFFEQKRDNKPWKQEDDGLADILAIAGKCNEKEV